MSCPYIWSEAHIEKTYCGVWKITFNVKSKLYIKAYYSKTKVQMSDIM